MPSSEMIDCTGNKVMNENYEHQTFPLVLLPPGPQHQRQVLSQEDFGFLGFNLLSQCPVANIGPMMSARLWTLLSTLTYLLCCYSNIICAFEWPFPDAATATSSIPLCNHTHIQVSTTRPRSTLFPDQRIGGREVSTGHLISTYRRGKSISQALPAFVELDGIVSPDTSNDVSSAPSFEWSTHPSQPSSAFPNFNNVSKNGLFKPKIKRTLTPGVNLIFMLGV